MNGWVCVKKKTMSIQIKPYYCPKCQSFKQWYDVVADDDFSICHYCRSCGTECYDTEALLEMIISEKAAVIYSEEKNKL